VPTGPDKEAVRAANRLEDVIPALTGEPLSRNGGREVLVKCAFHADKHPSMRINVEKQVWRCDPCNLGGDVFVFVERYQGVAFREALATLADRAGLSHGNGSRASSTPVSSRSTARPARRSSPRVLREFDYPQADGLLVRKVRYDVEESSDKMRWKHSRDGGRTWVHALGCADPGLYGIDEAIAIAQRKQTEAVLIAEGERDARRLLDLGLPAVSPPHGAAVTMGDKWRAAYSDRLKTEGFTRAYLFGDHDAAGGRDLSTGNGFNGEIARALTAAGIDARPVLWDAAEPEKFDVTDFLDRHGETDGRRLIAERIVAVKNGDPWRDPTPIGGAAPAPSPTTPSARRSKKDKDTAGRVLKLDDPEPWPDPVSGDQLLADLAALLTAFVVFVDPAHADGLALWIVHTFSMDAWWISPLAVVNSPTMRCGKSTALQLVAHLASRALPASNISPAALFRAIERYHPTLMLDEAETFLKDNEELRGLVNAGHTRKTAVVIRTVGEQHEAAVFSTWCPKFIALIGRLPATLMDRALIIPMRRKMAGEQVERLRLDRIDARCLPLRRQMVRWAADSALVLREADPSVPATLDDRAADNWRPLLAVADAAGPAWGERARRAAQQVSGTRDAEESSALALLRDTRTVFDELEESVTEVTSAQLVDRLNQLDDRPWADHRHGKGITAAWFAARMKEFDVVPGGPYWFFIDGRSKQARGYRRANFADAWNRYLGGTQTVTCNNVNNDGPKSRFQGVTAENDRYTLKTAVEPMNTGLCYGVTVSEADAPAATTIDQGPAGPGDGERERVRL